MNRPRPKKPTAHESARDLDERALRALGFDPMAGGPLDGLSLVDLLLHGCGVPSFGGDPVADILEGAERDLGLFASALSKEAEIGIGDELPMAVVALQKRVQVARELHRRIGVERARLAAARPARTTTKGRTPRGLRS